MVEPSGPQDWLRWYAQVGDTLDHPGTPGESLHAIVLAAVATVPGASWASITRGVGEGFTTVTASAPIARAADHLQYTSRGGPAVDTAVGHPVLHSGDLVADERWPEFGPRVAREIGIHSVLSVRLTLDPDDLNVCLNIYAPHAYAFTNRSIAVATMLATHAATVFTATERPGPVQLLQTSVTSTHDIGVAMGILMHTHGVAQEEALVLLRIAAQHGNRPLRDVAREVTATGTLDLPLPGPATPGGAEPGGPTAGGR